MGFGTHLFRHTYGVKLAELYLDDAAIAHLLGHRGMNCVYERGQFLIIGAALP